MSIIPDAVAIPPADSRPVIGICAAWERASWSFWDQPAALVAATYLDTVRRSGGLPIALIPEDLERGAADSIAARIDALLLIGGSDLDPASYGALTSLRTEAISPPRDRFELVMTRTALDHDLPVLGICRGLQILNVATGGTLYQHLLDAGFAEHRPAPGRLDEPTFHEVEIVPDSLLGAVAGAPRMTVNSHHHQGLADLGASARVVARSVPDGVVEAVEWSARRFVLGVQWHPEALARDATVRALIHAASTGVCSHGAAEQVS